MRYIASAVAAALISMSNYAAADTVGPLQLTDVQMDHVVAAGGYKAPTGHKGKRPMVVTHNVTRTTVDQETNVKFDDLKIIAVKSTVSVNIGNNTSTVNN